MMGLLQNTLKASFPRKRESRNHKARRKKLLDSLVKPENDNLEAFRNSPMMAKKLLLMFSVFFVLSLVAHADISRDSSNNLYYFNGNNHFISNDSGNTWRAYKDNASWGKDIIFRENSDGKLFAFYLENNNLYYRESANKQIFSDPERILSGFNPQSFDVFAINGVFHVFYFENNLLKYLSSSDKGKIFLPTQTVSGINTVSDWIAYNNGNSIHLCFASQNKLYKSASSNNGMTFSLPEEIYSTNVNNIKSIIKYNNSYLPDNFEIFWVEESKNKTQQACKYMSILRSSPVDIYTTENSFSNIEALSLSSASVLLFSKEIDLSPKMSMIKVYKDGSLINNIQDIESQFYNENDLIGINLANNKLNLFYDKNGDIIKLSHRNNAPKVKITEPYSGFSTNKNAVQVFLNGVDQDNDLISYSVMLSSDKSFPQGKTVEFVNLSNISQISLPFPDGLYYLKAQATDGIANATGNEIVEIKIDKTPPKISIIKPENISYSSSETIEIYGILSEEAAIQINGAQISLFKPLSFTKTLKLIKGENAIIVNAVDLAGNATHETISVFFNPDAPQVTINRPRDNSFYKKGSTILISADIIDKSNGFLEDAEAETLIDDKKLQASLSYDNEEGVVSGLIILPDDLSEGKHILTLKIKDAGNNTGFAKAGINFDNLAPSIQKSSIVASPKNIVIPIIEEGIGLDPSLSSIKVLRGSLEVYGKLKIEDKKFVFYPAEPLFEGNYTLTYSLRDLIGNSSSLESVTINCLSSQAYALDISAKDLKINSIEYGPNPFSPKKGEETTIKYNLSKTCDIDFFVFSLPGELIYKKSVLGSGALDLFSWDGKDAIGGTVDSGIYPFVFIVKESNVKKDLKRGKLIVF